MHLMTTVMTVVPAGSIGERPTLSGPSHPLRSLLMGDGDTCLLCGACGFVIGDRLVSTSHLGEIVFQCPRCDAHNVLSP